MIKICPVHRKCKNRKGCKHIVPHVLIEDFQGYTCNHYCRDFDNGKTHVTCVEYKEDKSFWANLIKRWVR